MHSCRDVMFPPRLTVVTHAFGRANRAVSGGGQAGLRAARHFRYKYSAGRRSGM